MLNFSQALIHIKEGGKVARRGWNGKGMFVFYVSASTFQVNRPPLLGIYEEGKDIYYRAHIDIKATDGSIGTWTPSMTDLLANDWVLL